MPYKINPTEALKTGWNMFKGNPWLFVGTTAVSLFLSQDVKKMSDSSDGTLALISLIFSLVSLWVSAGILKMYLKYVRGDHNIKFVDIFDVKDLMLLAKFLGASILLGLLIMVGLVLLIVPGIYFLLTYGYAPYLVMDKNMGIMDAFKKSAQMTKGVKMDLLVFGLLSFGVMIIGFVALLVGVLVAIPVAYLASLYIYNNLLNHANKSKETDTAVTGTIEAPVA